MFNNHENLITRYTIKSLHTKDIHRYTYSRLRIRVGRDYQQPLSLVPSYKLFYSSYYAFQLFIDHSRFDLNTFFLAVLIKFCLPSWLYTSTSPPKFYSISPRAEIKYHLPNCSELKVNVGIRCIVIKYNRNNLQYTKLTQYRF